MYNYAELFASVNVCSVSVNTIEFIQHGHVVSISVFVLLLFYCQYKLISCYFYFEASFLFHN